MSDFACRVHRLEVEEVPGGAQFIQLARVGDFRSIVKRDSFKTGDLGVYIPENAIVPDNLLEEMGLVGRLGGKLKNIVRPMKMRGMVSEGLIYPIREGWVEGQDVTEELGVTKYEPPIPIHMQGQVWNAGSERTLHYDIENFKAHPDVFKEGEEVVFTEKIHGTFLLAGAVCEDLKDEEEGHSVVASKGLASRGLAFKLNEENKANLYVRAFRKILDQVFSDWTEIQEKFFESQNGKIRAVFVLGEIFGKGVQSLDYGASAGSEGTLGVRVFDIYIKSTEGNYYLDDEELDKFCSGLHLERVPVLYRGPFSKEKMLEYTSGKEVVSGRQLHIREGIVVKPVKERRNDVLGRVILKSVSEAYLNKATGDEIQ